LAIRVGAGQSAQNEYARRLRAWRTASRRRFLLGLPVVLATAALLEWWIGWHAIGVPLYGHIAALTVIVAWGRSLTAPQHVTAWRSGAEGERKTARALTRLARRGAVILHDRAMGQVANLDTLAIGPWGIAAINTKNWQVKGAKVAVSRDGATLWYGTKARNKEVAGVRREARQAASAVRDSLGSLPAEVQPIMAVWGARVGRRGILYFDGVTVLEARQLARYLRRQRVVLSPAEIARAGLAAGHALPPKT